MSDTHKIKIIDLLFDKYRKPVIGLICLIATLLLLASILFDKFSILTDNVEITLGKNNLFPIILSLSMICFIISIISFSLFSFKEKSIYDKKTPITKHPIFMALRREISNDFDIKGEFLSIKLRVWVKYLEKIVTNKEIFESNEVNIFDYLVEEQNKAIKKYEMEWKNRGFSKNTIETFSKLHNENMRHIMHYLSIILNSEIDKDTHSKLVAICNGHLFMLDLSKSLIEKSLKDGTLIISKN